MPKVPFPRNSPSCNCDGWMVAAPAADASACCDFNSDGDKAVGTDGTNPNAIGGSQTRIGMAIMSSVRSEGVDTASTAAADLFLL